MKFYYALFKKTSKAIEVEFPDLPGCVTFGKTWEDALEKAEDVLAGWLVHVEADLVKQPSKHAKLEHLDGTLIPITINETIMDSYRESKRFNVIFPADVLKRVDIVRKKAGLKRSTFLQKAVEAYLYTQRDSLN